MPWGRGGRAGQSMYDVRVAKRREGNLCRRHCNEAEQIVADLL